MEPDNGSLQTDEIEKSNSKMVEIDGETIEYDQLIREYKSLKDNAITNKKLYRKAVSKYLQEKELKPYQAELIKMQQTLEKTGQKMIILFEGRDAAGKGGTIRRVTRYMNEKHYRVVALGRP
ncbi:MAG: polyphosphate kinase 2, partial [Calditrichaeota bacterium]|nr:polyphosphate kinase 2 [Calditrichota bacterium]